MAASAQVIPPPQQREGWWVVREFEYQAQCPHCQRVLGIVTTLAGRPPEVGWANLCLECGGISIFVADGASMRLRAATEAEHVEAMQVSSLRLGREAVLERERADTGGGS